MDVYLSAIDAMTKVSNEFASHSNGILKVAIGSIDGWLVQIVRLSLSREFIKNPTSFFSRKGFYALNVQCIVDDQK